MAEPRHRPVMAREVLERLDPRPGQVVLDATVGLGGHAALTLLRLLPGGRLLGLDRDPEALELARQALRLVGGPAEGQVGGPLGGPLGGAVLLRHGRFSMMGEALREASLPAEGGLHGVLFDLGVSSYQLEEGRRGFSFSREGPLDMRMDPGAGESAAELLARAPVEEIERVLREYGEEPSARRIARAIDRRRREGPLATTLDLARVVEEVLPRRGRRTHPATRTFQALRIAVNDELTELRQALLGVDRLLVRGGRVVALSYHSLEDRIVKQVLREREREGILVVDRPDPLMPTDEEITENPRARSARLRSARRA